MHYAYAYGFEDLAEYLKSKGADDRPKNADGLTCYEGLSMVYDLPTRPPQVHFLLLQPRRFAGAELARCFPALSIPVVVGCARL